MKDYLLKLFPKDSRSAEMIFSYFEEVGHDSSSSEVTLDELKTVLAEILKDYEKGTIDYEDLAVLCDKLEILMKDVDGYRESRTSALITELADIDWALKDKTIDSREYVKKILAKYSI